MGMQRVMHLVRWQWLEVLDRCPPVDLPRRAEGDGHLQLKAYILCGKKSRKFRNQKATSSSGPFVATPACLDMQTSLQAETRQGGIVAQLHEIHVDHAKLAASSSFCSTDL